MRKFWGAAAVLAVLATTGCVTAESPPAPEPTETTDVSQAPFASEEEALAAAEEAYRAFLAVADKALQTASPPSDNIKNPTGNALDDLLQSVRAIERSSRRQTGNVAVVRVSPADTEGALTSPTLPIQIYSCADYGEVDVLDAQGNSVVDPARPDLIAFLVTLLHDGQQLVVSDLEPWTGDGVC